MKASVTVAVSIATLFLGGTPGFSQTCRDLKTDLPGILLHMRDPTWKIRAKAMYDLMACGFHEAPAGRTYLFPRALKNIFEANPEQESTIREALISLLETENKVASRPFLDDFSDYYGDAVGAVAAINELKAEPRSLEALIGAIQTGNMATNALAGLGDPALTRVLQLTVDPQALLRMSAMFVLEDMLRPTDIAKFREPSNVREIIKAVFVKGLRDKDPIVRADAAHGLETVGDPDVIPLLEALAQNDPFCFTGQIADDGSGDLCPARLAARRALASIRSKN